MSSLRVARGSFTRWCRTCGWKRTYDKADRAKRAHSCERWLRKAAAAERGRVRMAAVDRTPKPCHHKLANHQHGTYACYTLDACRCQPCVTAVTEYERNRVRQQAYGRWDNLVDAEPVRAHLVALGQYGIGLKTVAKLSGVSNGSLTKIVYGAYRTTGMGKSAGRHGVGELVRGPAKRVRKATVEKILAVEAVPANLPPRQPDFERTPTAVRHLQALVALGWSVSKLGDRLGISRANMTPIVHGRRPLSRGTVDSVEALYEELSMTLPPAQTHRDKIAYSRALKFSRDHGWVPPLELEALDDHERYATLTLAELAEEGLDNEQIAALFGCTVEDVSYYWYLHGRPEPRVDAEVDLDDVAIERRMAGARSVRLSKAEAAELVRRWDATGRPRNECERVTGVNPQRFGALAEQELAS